MTSDNAAPQRPAGVTAFRRLWVLTIASNMAALVQTVAAAWLMTRIGTPIEVALIQSAIAVPVMALALLAGTLADTADRRQLILVSCLIMLIAAVVLAAMSVLDMMQPGPLLALCILFGCGNALFDPTGMASVADHLPRALVPDGVASVGVAFNVARVLGPALGGVLIGTAGLTTTFLLNMFACFGMVALQLGAPRRANSPGGDRLMPSFIGGLVFATRDTRMRVALLRSVAFAAAASSIWELLPLVSRDQLHGTSSTFGTLMSAMGIGAILCTWQLSRLRQALPVERLLQIACGSAAICLLLLSFASRAWIAAMLLVPLGAAWVAHLTLCNITVQLIAPLNMGGRAIGAFYTASFGGLAIGSWAWGLVSEQIGLGTALILSAAACALTGCSGLAWPLSAHSEAHPALEGLHE